VGRDDGIAGCSRERAKVKYNSRPSPQIQSARVLPAIHDDESSGAVRLRPALAAVRAMNTAPDGSRPPALAVVAAVLRRGDGAVLLAERPPGRVAAGFWEFPGGKIEAGESAERALAREIREEIGIEVREAWPWISFEHGPAERRVHLYFHRVTRWEGEPRPCEGQRLAWVDPAAPAVAPLLPANDRMLRALTLPGIYAITDAARHGIAAFMPRLEAALERGVRLVQVRERGLDRAQQLDFVRAVVARARVHGARVLVNGDEALAFEGGADGVHLRAEQLMAATAAPRIGFWGASCHDGRELAQAAALGADFAVLSPVLPTASHPGDPGMGWAAFASRLLDCPLPVYALGGMREDLYDMATRQGAHGIALLRGIW
jgi:8-oxo-dGTP diphosphatase